MEIKSRGQGEENRGTALLDKAAQSIFYPFAVLLLVAS